MIEANNFIVVSKSTQIEGKYAYTIKASFSLLHSLWLCDADVPRTETANDYKRVLLNCTGDAMLNVDNIFVYRTVLHGLQLSLIHI